MLKTFFINSDYADYGEEEMNYLQKFLLDQGVLHTQGANWNDFIDLAVSENDTPDMSVNVAIGNAVIETERNSVAFKVFVFNNAEVNLPISDNSSGDTRMDAIILKLSRTVEPNALMNNVATIEVVEGTSAVALTDNAIQTEIGADYDFLRLANVAVDDSETTILDADIGDTRTRVLTTDSIQYSPTVLKFKVVTADPSSPVEGEMWYNDTDNVMRYYDGTAVINMETSSFTGGNGIDITSGSISIDLATDSGLEFSGGKLKALSPVKVSATLGEDITVSGNPLPVFLGDGADNSEKYPQRGYNYNTPYPSYDIEAYGVNQILLAFKTGKYQTRLTSIKARFAKRGSPSGNAVFTLYLADANHKPTGSALSTVTMTATDLPSSSTITTAITFPSIVDVDSDTKYCLVITAISASNSSNCVLLYYNTSASGESYSTGTSSDSGSTWSVTSGRYSGLKVIGYSDYEAGKIYLSDFTEQSRQRMNGFIKESKVTDDAYSLQVNGCVSGFSSLVNGLDYYLNTIKNVETIEYTSNNSSVQFGKVSGYTRVGQTITTANLLYPNSIIFKVYRVGSPTDTVVCKIYDSVGGTLLATSEEKDLSEITTSTTGVNVAFTFPDVKLSPSTQYFFELERTGTTSNVDYYGIRYQSSSSYSGGAKYDDRSINSSTDLYFILSMGYASLSKDVSSGIFLGKALSSSSLLLTDFRGMIKKVSESGSHTLATTTKTFNSPILAKKVKINFYYVHSPYVFRDQIEVEKGESIQWTDYYGSTAYNFDVSWRGNAITITTYDLPDASWTATLYFYN